MKKTKDKPKIITVQPISTQTAIVPKYRGHIFTPEDRAKAKANNVNRGRVPRSPLDIALENFLLEEVPVPAKKNGKVSRKKLARQPRMRALIRAIYIQAIKGTGKGRLAELIFERVGGKPGQTVYTEEFSASYSDPELRKRRIKELQKSLKVRIST